MKAPSKTEQEGRTLLLDLTVCDGSECDQCEAICDNPNHPGNNGISKLREQATFAHYCRQCEDQACLKACPVDALEKNEDGVVERSNLLCIGCDSCVMACPFGTIFTELIPFLDSTCDLCAGKEGEPSCVSTCPYGGLKSVPAGHEPEGENWYKQRDGLFIHVEAWQPELLGNKGGKQ